jgi:cysteine desulfurase
MLFATRHSIISFYMFSISKARAYLDYASSAPTTVKAQRAFMRALKYFGNPGAVHTEGQQAKALLQKARETIARVVQTKEHTITFTASSTESNSLAIIGTVETHLLSGKQPAQLSVLYVDGSHSSITEPMKYLQKRGVNVICAKFSDAEPLLSVFETLLREDTVLVSLERVNSETGYIFDTKNLARLVHQKSKQAVVHVDATQSPLFEQISWTRLGADLLTFDAQKIGGIRGIGALVKNTIHSITPRIYGGGQEWGMRSGTVSVALAHSFAMALKDAQDSCKKFEERTRSLRLLTISIMSKIVPDILINEGKENAPHILNISLPRRDTEYLSYLLDAEGVSVSTKSSCDEGSSLSRAVLAQTGDEVRAAGTLRISFGVSSTKRDLKKLTHALEKSLPIIDKAHK